MAAIWNMVRRFLREAGREGAEFDADSLEAKLMSEMDAASGEAARRASEILWDGAMVLTCSHSSAILGTFKAALASGKRFSVAAVESRVGTLPYGENMVKDVSTLGLGAVLVADSAIYEAVHKVNVAMVGADTWLPDGGIINGWPTLGLGQAARNTIPLYVVCEAYKLSDAPGIEAGYDLVPPSLITAVITYTRLDLK